MPTTPPANNPPSESDIESVWDYPRPPRLEPTPRRLRILHRGILIADTTRALRILETSHPPVFYLPPADIAMQYLKPSTQRLARARRARSRRRLPRRRLELPRALPRLLRAARSPGVLRRPGRRMHGGRRDRPAPARRLLRRMDHLARHRPVQRPSRHAGLVAPPEASPPHRYRGTVPHSSQFHRDEWARRITPGPTLQDLDVPPAILGGEFNLLSLVANLAAKLECRVEYIEAGRSSPTAVIFP
jgi:hypothetical protein